MVARTMLVAALCFLAAGFSPSMTLAQESRAAAIAQQQTEKAGALHKYEPPKAERIFLAVKKEFLDTPSGLYPLFGSVYGGGGLALGGGYRRYYGDHTFWDIKGLWSIRNYRKAELSTHSPGHAGGRLDLGAHIGWLDATQVAYYGLGSTTAPGNRTNFRLNQAYAGVEAKARPVPWVVLGGGSDYEDFNLRKGLGTTPTVEQVHTESTAPGFSARPKYVHSMGSAGIDWRPASGYARRGGLYEVRYHNYLDTDDVYRFDRIDAEIVQHLPLLRENWVLSVHGLVNTTMGDGDAVPYYLLPSLGSASTLRGFPAWRFRDRHSLLVQGEFRWIPSRNGIDMAVFYDAGKVTSRRADLNFEGLKSDVGAEVSFHGPGSTPLRFGMARSNEGWHFVFGGAAAF